MEMEFEGLDDLIKEFEELATEDELEVIDRRILDECGNLAQNTVKKEMAYSKNHSKSGIQHKNTNRQTPSGHARDNVPVGKIRKRKGRLEKVVGWEKNKGGDYEYYNFKEFGTSKMQPLKSFGLTNKKLYKTYNKITYDEYEKELKKRLEGK